MIEFTELEGVLKAPNPKMNATVASGTKVQKFFEALGLPVGRVVLNRFGLGEVPLIPVHEISGVPADEPLHLQVELNGNLLNVALVLGHMKHFGPWDALPLLCKDAGFEFVPLDSPRLLDAVKESVAEAWKA